MRRSFESFKLPAGFSRDPRVVMRLVIGTLLVANLVAAFTVIRPVGGSAEQLELEVARGRQQIMQKQATLKRLQFLASKIEQARNSGDSFMDTYFMSRRTTSSTILDELLKAAKDSGIKPKGDAFTFEPVEGSDTLSMMTIAANYEGTYRDLLEFVNRLDRSPKFLILENLTAQPLQGGGSNAPLDVRIKLDTFVREDAAAR
jgi:type IV pilus assembly protein PilO